MLIRTISIATFLSLFSCSDNQSKPISNSNYNNTVNEKFDTSHSLKKGTEFKLENESTNDFLAGIIGDWNWEKNDEKGKFTITFSLRDNYLIGRYCCILNDGAEIDCSDEDNTYSFKVKLPIRDNKLETVFKANNSEGLGRLLLIKSGKKLTWKVLKQPDDLFICPMVANFIKEK